MKIAAVSVLEYSRPLDGRSWNPSFRWTERRAPLVLVEGESGLIGIGEAWSRQPAIGLILAYLAEIVAPSILGAELTDSSSISRIANQVRLLPQISGEPWIAAAALSAFDMALWDLLAKSRAQPLWRALGGHSNQVNVYSSGGLYCDGDGVNALTAEMRSYIAAGFRAVKMKVGALPLESDLERVRAVRTAIGADAELWVDAVNQLTHAVAMPWAVALAEAGATAIQAPVPFWDLETMARINADCLAVIAGEAECEIAAFDDLLGANAVTLVQPCLGLCGGFSAATAIASRAQARLIDTTVQTFGTAAMQAASLHWGAATAGVHSVEYHRFHDHLAPLMEAGLRTVTDGRVVLGEEPGLGVCVPVCGAQPDGGEIRCHRRIQIDEAS